MKVYEKTPGLREDQDNQDKSLSRLALLWSCCIFLNSSIDGVCISINQAKVNILIERIFHPHAWVRLGHFSFRIPPR